MSIADRLYPNPCPVCGAHLAQPFTMRGHVQAALDCPNCGDHQLTFEAHEFIGMSSPNALLRARRGFAVRKLPSGGLITSELVTQLDRETDLPSATEQVERLVAYLAANGRPGERLQLVAATLRATLGAATEQEAQWVLHQAMRLELIAGKEVGTSTSQELGLEDAVLTINGWQRHVELLRDGARSRHAFMAMKFNDPEMDMVFANMQEAIAQTGFTLRTVAGDHKKAGSIDDRMRVEIRTSRFLVCDLTHGNQGAYWESGFAEGLGRPVFYTCKRDVLADRAHLCHPHFDTAHQLIVAWDPTDLAPAMLELKSVVRNTLPAEAKMRDERAPPA